MAKPRAKSRKAPVEVGPRRDRVAEAEAHLRTCHALGVLVRHRLQEGKLDTVSLQRLVEETGLGADHIRKARVFAARYTPRQPDELCALRTPVGMPLAWRHVRQLLALPPGEARDTIQRQAAERGWSLEELTVAIARKLRRAPTRAGCGRTFQGPRSLADGLRQLTRHSEAWVRRFGSRAWAGDEWLAGKVGAAGPGGLAARLTATQEALQALSESINALVARLQQVEVERVGTRSGRQLGGQSADPLEPRRRPGGQRKR